MITSHPDAPENQQIRFLEVPTDPPSYIPVRLTEEDYQLLLQTLNLWHDRITSKRT